MVRLLMVPIIMACALVGTVGMIKVIGKFSPEQFDHNESTKKKEEKNE